MPRRRRFPRVLPRPLSLRAVQVDFARDVTAALRQVTERLRRFLLEDDRWRAATEELRRARGLDEMRLDQTAAEDITEELEELRLEFFRDQPDSVIEDMLLRYGRRINDKNRESFRRQFKALLGLDIIAFTPNGDEILKGYVVDNVNLIKTIQAEKFAKVRAIVTRGWRQGIRWDEIADQVEHDFSLDRFKAVRIARDQVGKLNGEFSRDRQKAAGVEKFTWRTSQDGRVRSAHAALEGKVFEWAKGHQTEGIPGQPIQCRCHAEPVLEDEELPGESPLAAA